jgi:hypothetical protein
VTPTFRLKRCLSSHFALWPDRRMEERQLNKWHLRGLGGTTSFLSKSQMPKCRNSNCQLQIIDMTIFPNLT